MIEVLGFRGEQGDVGAQGADGGDTDRGPQGFQGITAHLHIQLQFLLLILVQQMVV